MSLFWNLVRDYTLVAVIMVSTISMILFIIRGIQRWRVGYKRAGRLFIILALAIFAMGITPILEEPYASIAGLLGTTFLMLFWFHAQDYRKSQIILLSLVAPVILLSFIGIISPDIVSIISFAEAIVVFVILVYGYIKTEIYAPFGLSAAILLQIVAYALELLVGETVAVFTMLSFALSLSFLLSVAIMGGTRRRSYAILSAEIMWFMIVIGVFIVSAFFAVDIPMLDAYTVMIPLAILVLSLAHYGLVFTRRYSYYGDEFSHMTSRGVVFLVAGILLYEVYYTLNLIQPLPFPEFIVIFFLKGYAISMVFGYYYFGVGIYKIQQKHTTFLDITLATSIAFILWNPEPLSTMGVITIHSFIIASSIIMTFPVLNRMAYIMGHAKRKKEAMWIMLATSMLILTSFVLMMPSLYHIVFMRHLNLQEAPLQAGAYYIVIATTTILFAMASIGVKRFIKPLEEKSS